MGRMWHQRGKVFTENKPLLPVLVIYIFYEIYVSALIADNVISYSGCVFLQTSATLLMVHKQYLITGQVILSTSFKSEEIEFSQYIVLNSLRPSGAQIQFRSLMFGAKPLSEPRLA